MQAPGTLDQPNLREVYAQYFFTVLEARLQENDAGRRQAQVSLEEALTDVHA